MKIFKKLSFSTSIHQKPDRWLSRIEKMINSRRERRAAEKNRREVIKLGDHLLKDLGVNPRGYPLKHDWRTAPFGRVPMQANPSTLRQLKVRHARNTKHGEPAPAGCQPEVSMAFWKNWFPALETVSQLLSPGSNQNYQ